MPCKVNLLNDPAVDGYKMQIVSVRTHGIICHVGQVVVDDEDYVMGPAWMVNSFIDTFVEFDRDIATGSIRFAEGATPGPKLRALIERKRKEANGETATR